jgi:hypothetical protein
MSPYGQDRWHSEAKACDTVDMMTSAKNYFGASKNIAYTRSERNELPQDAS